MIKIKNLHLENYRNIGRLDLDFGGSSGSIVGKNRIGKTNCIEAICFLLTGKLLAGSSDIASVKPLNDTRAKVVVEATFETDNGSDVTFKKEYYEKWVRPRGSENEELQGHNLDLYVNGAKQSKVSSYESALVEKLGIPTSFGDLDAYQLMIDPFYLGIQICGSKDWKGARKAIVDIIGEVTNDEIFASEPKLEVVKADLDKHQYNEAETKKAIKGEIEALKKQKQSNDSVILNETNSVEEITVEAEQEAKAKREETNKRIYALEQGDFSEYANEKSKLTSEIYSLNQEKQKVLLAPIDRTKSNAICKEITEVSVQIGNMKAEALKTKSNMDILKSNAEASLRKCESIKKEAEAIKAEAVNLKIVDVCPTCGQPIPKDKVEEAREKELSDIRRRYSDKVAEYRDEKARYEAIQAEIKGAVSPDYEKEIAELKEKEAELTKDYEKAYLEENNSRPQVDPSIEEAIKSKKARYDEIEALISQGKQSKAEEIEALKAELSTYEDIIVKRAMYVKSVNKLNELKEANSKLGKTMATAEQRLWAIDEFVRIKLSILDAKMNGKFGEVRFQLISPNIKSGSYDEVCKPYIVSPKTKKRTLTLFDSGSKSEQIYTGIRIIKAIREAKGWDAMPIIFDEGGELDSETAQALALEAQSQTISVKVQGDYSKPTFEKIN